MLDMGGNQHLWKDWVDDDRVRDVLGEGAKRLKRAWTLDKKDPGSYPMNTAMIFAEIEEALKGRTGLRTRSKAPPPPPPSESLAELVDEKVIAAVYEDQNEGSYKNALKQASEGFGKGAKVWRKISRAVDAAYLIQHLGIEFAPKPRVHFLHRNLLSLAESRHLGGFTLEGVVEFLNDMCPCGKKHNEDAIRKLRKRWARA